MAIETGSPEHDTCIERAKSSDEWIKEKKGKIWYWPYSPSCTLISLCGKIPDSQIYNLTHHNVFQYIKETIHKIKK